MRTTNVEGDELLLLEDGLERVRGRGPGALLLLQAEVVERGADGDDELALERLVGRGNAVVVALGQLKVARGLREHGRGVVGLGGLVGADGHQVRR